MKNVIILGSNSISMNIAETLCDNPDINLYIIESSEEKYRQINDSLDAYFILGKEIEPKTLLKANIENCDILLSLCDSDSVNITVSLLARYFNKNVKIINHIDKNSEENYKILNNTVLKVDSFISPENLTAKHVEELIKHPEIIEYNKILNGKFTIIAFEIKNNSPFVDKKLSQIKECFNEYSMLIIGIDNKKYFKVPRGDATIKEGDVIYILVSGKNIRNIFEIFSIKRKSNKKILIGGGGRYSEALIDLIYNKTYNITVLDRSRNRIDYLKEKYPNINYLLTDIRNLNHNESKELFDVDLYIAMTDNDNINFITSVYALKSGVNVISLYFEQENFELFNHYGIKRVVNPKSLVIDELLSYFHLGKIISVSSLWNESIEMLEIIPSATSPIINKKLKDLKYYNILIGVIEHNGIATIANGESIIKENDKILFFAPKNKVDEILKRIN